MSINISALWNKPYRKKNKKDMILMLKLKSTLEVKRKKTHIVYLIDSSGSMGISVERGNNYQPIIGLGFNGDVANNYTTKLDRVKSAVFKSIELLTEEDLFSVISYSDDAKIVIENVKATVENKNLAIANISRIRATGGTNTFNGLNVAISEMNKIKEKNISKRVFLLTDGENTDGVRYETFYNLARNVYDSEFPISISSFGVGEGFNEEFLLELSLSGNGNFYFLYNKDDFKSYFEQETGELKNIAYKDIRMDYSSFNFDNMELINDFKKDDQGRFILPNIISEKEIVLAIKGNAIGKDSRVRLTISGLNLNSNTLEVNMQDLSVDISGDDYINKEVEDFSIKMEIAKKQKEISDSLRKNDVKSARDALSRTMLMSTSLSSSSYSSEIQGKLNSLSKTIDDGNLNLASKSALNESYLTNYTRK